jgi:hypothetical protein
MAKKKATTARGTGSKKEAAWTKEEQAVFAALGVGEGDLALRKFIRGQRRINGRLYEAIDLILVHLKKQATGKAVSIELKKAEKINDGVPGLLTGFTAGLSAEIGLGGGGGGLWGDPETDAD